MEQLKNKLRDQFWKMWIVTHGPLLIGLRICKVVWGLNQSHMELGFPEGKDSSDSNSNNSTQGNSIELPFKNSQIPEITITFNFHLSERLKASEVWEPADSQTRSTRLLKC